MVNESQVQWNESEIENKSRMVKAVEAQAHRIPSAGIFTLALASMGVSAFTSLVLKNRSLGNFFGLWTPSLLMLAIYKKIVGIESRLDRQTLH